MGRMDGGMPALPTHSGQMVVSQGGLALPSAEASSNLKHREDEINTSQDLQNTRFLSELALSPPEGSGESTLKVPLLGCLRSGARAQGPWLPGPVECKLCQRVSCLVWHVPSGCHPYKSPISWALMSDRPSIEYQSCQLEAV